MVLTCATKFGPDVHSVISRCTDRSRRRSPLDFRPNNQAPASDGPPQRVTSIRRSVNDKA
jgi:hypothetical protein